MNRGFKSWIEIEESRVDSKLRNQGLITNRGIKGWLQIEEPIGLIPNREIKGWFQAMELRVDSKQRNWDLIQSKEFEVDLKRNRELIQMELWINSEGIGDFK